MPAHIPWRRKASRYLYTSKWYRLRQDDLTLPDGEEITYTVVEHPGWAMAVPLLDDGRVLVEWIYRYTLGKINLEFPSGGLDGEPPLVAARRELEEETGYRAREWIPLGTYNTSSGNSDVVFHAFLARGVTADGQLQREATEQIELALVPLEELVRQAYAGEIENAPTALAILLADNWLRKNGQHAQR